MHYSRGGMGSYKHGTSGHSGPSPKDKINRARDANLELHRKEQAKAKRRKIHLYSSVTEALKKHG